MRLKARAVLTALLALAVAAPVIATTIRFPDVKDNHRHAEAINWAANLRDPLFKGYPDGHFRPDQQLSEREFQVVVERLFGHYDGWTRAETAGFLYAGDRALKTGAVPTTSSPAAGTLLRWEDFYEPPGDHRSLGISAYIDTDGSAVVRADDFLAGAGFSEKMKVGFVFEDQVKNYQMGRPGETIAVDIPMFGPEPDGQFAVAFPNDPDYCGKRFFIRYSHPRLLGELHAGGGTFPCAAATTTTTAATTTTTRPVVIETTTTAVSPATTHFDNSGLSVEDRQVLSQFWSNWRVVMSLAWEISNEWDVMGQASSQINEVGWSQRGLQNISNYSSWTDDLFTTAEGWVHIVEDNIVLSGRTDYLVLAETKWSEAYRSAKDLAADARGWLSYVPQQIALPAPQPPSWSL